MTITRTVKCTGKSISQYEGKERYSLSFEEPRPEGQPEPAENGVPVATIACPQSFYIEEATKEEFDSKDVGGTYTVTIS